MNKKVPEISVLPLFSETLLMQSKRNQAKKVKYYQKRLNITNRHNLSFYDKLDGLKRIADMLVLEAIPLFWDTCGSL